MTISARRLIEMLREVSQKDREADVVVIAYEGTGDNMVCVRGSVSEVMYDRKNKTVVVYVGDGWVRG